VTERAYDNPKFVEDLVRDIALRLMSEPRIANGRLLPRILNPSTTILRMPSCSAPINKVMKMMNKNNESPSSVPAFPVLASAWLLGREHEVTLFEAGQYLGGHTNTVDVHLEGKTHPVDTGFLVFNEKTYPNLIAMFAVAWRRQRRDRDVVRGQPGKSGH
jgi:hypothetical protein